MARRSGFEGVHGSALNCSGIGLRRSKGWFVLQAMGRTTGIFGTLVGGSQCSEGAYREGGGGRGGGGEEEEEATRDRH